MLASFVSDILAAPVGTAFTYQGRLKSAGQPANGNYDLRFTLYDAASGSGQVGSPVTNAPVIVTNGNFTVSLDFGAVFSGEARWLEIGVRTNGSSSPYGTLSPRQPLTPTPYALYAPSAGLAATATTAGTANNLAGNLSGDVTGTQTATVVARVGGQTATDVASGSVTANAATSANTPDRIVKRDASGNFSAGAITAGSFTGNGAGLTGLNANNLATGTLADGRLSGNVALLNANQTFSGSNIFTGVSTLTNATNMFAGTFSGNGGGLTNLNASQLASGTVPSDRLSGTYAGALTFNNAANSFAGNGSALTALNAGNLASGTVPGARLSGTYSNAVTFTNGGNSFSGNGAGLTNLNAGSSGERHSPQRAAIRHLFQRCDLHQRRQQFQRQWGRAHQPERGQSGERHSPQRAAIRHLFQRCDLQQRRQQFQRQWLRADHRRLGADDGLECQLFRQRCFVFHHFHESGRHRHLHQTAGQLYDRSHL